MLELVGKEQELLEDRAMRDRLAERIDVLDRVKALALLPDNLNATVEMAASYYEVSRDVIKQAISRNNEELTQDGLKVLDGDELSDMKSLGVIPKNTASLTLVPRRALLRIGMLLRDSAVAKQVRTYLLNVEQIARYDAPAVIAKATKSAEQTDTMLSVRRMRAEAYLLSERRKQGQALQSLIKDFADTLSLESIASLTAKSAELIAGEPVISLPAVGQHFLSCEQIAQRVGLFSAIGKPHKQAVAALLGKVAEEAEKLTVVEQNGAWQGTTVKYAESVVPKLEKYIKELEKPPVLKLDRAYHVFWR